MHVAVVLCKERWDEEWPVHRRPPGTPCGHNTVDRLVLFLAGDDRDAKQVEAQLVKQTGDAPVDTGSLHEDGRHQQLDSLILNQPLPVA